MDSGATSVLGLTAAIGVSDINEIGGTFTDGGTVTDAVGGLGIKVIGGSGATAIGGSSANVMGGNSPPAADSAICEDELKASGIP